VVPSNRTIRGVAKRILRDEVPNEPARRPRQRRSAWSALERNVRVHDLLCSPPGARDLSLYHAGRAFPVTRHTSYAPKRARRARLPQPPEFLASGRGRCGPARSPFQRLMSADVTEAYRMSWLQDINPLYQIEYQRRRASILCHMPLSRTLLAVRYAHVWA